MNEKRRLTFSELEATAHATYDRIMDSISKAHLVGTYGKDDRSKQYTEPNPHELLSAVNSAWSKIRSCESELNKKQAAIEELKKKVSRYKYMVSVFTSIITILAWKGLEALWPVLR